MFKTDTDGNVIWLPTTLEESIEFNANLFTENSTKDDTSLTGQLTKQLNNFASKTLEGSLNLSRTNKVYMNTLKAMLTRDLGVVDIIMPIYGGLHIVKPALEAIKIRTSYPYKLILVDDCSPDSKTTKFLEEWQKDNPEHVVLFQKVNKGFAASVNKGIRAGIGRYVCVLNSDVLVTENWLTKLVLALEADPSHVIVNPVTNNTALIDIPMHDGLNYLDMNRGLELLSAHKYPEIMPTGFCFMFKRDLTKQIGFLDEAYGSYGEESDYWMRALAYAAPDGTFPRYKAILADDTYLYHERGSSFGALGNDQHMQIRRGGSERFHKLWPQFKSWRKHNRLEENVQYLKTEMPSRVIEHTTPYNVAFLVFSSAYCGGMSVISDIVNEMIERGINAKIVQIKRDSSHQLRPAMGEIRTGVITFETPKEAIEGFGNKVFEEGVIISATNEMQQIASYIAVNFPKLINVLFSQSFDPGLAPTEEVKNHMEQQYHTVPYIISNAKWLDQTIKSITKRSTLGFVSPGVNLDLFYPRGRDKGDERPTVAFFLNPNDPYRGFDRGVEAAYHLSLLASANNFDIRILGIGVDAVQGAPYLTCLGGMSQPRLASFLATEVDIVVDPVILHSYGLPSLEGMASGAVSVCWDNVGINEYVTSGINGVIVPREAPAAKLAEAVFNTIRSNKLPQMKEAAIKIAEQHSRVAAVSTFIDKLEKGLHLRRQKRKIFVITPHLRKHGGPTTILHTAEMLEAMGHDVKICTVYPDINPEIIKETKIPLSINWKEPGSCDVVIVNSDNPHSEHYSYAPWAKKKVLLKLSHNPRFQKLEDDSLKLAWDAIVTSTDWLVKACAKPLVDQGWTHPPREAHRIGWFHYGHRDFECKYTNRKYFVNGQMNICTLIHQHPLKGTKEALTALAAMKEKYQDRINIFGVGEWPDFQKERPPWMQYYHNLDRKQMAELFKQMDIFLSASKTEGLGRMALEAMSASCLVIKTPTDAEFAIDMENCITANGFEPQDLLDALDKLGNEEEIFKRIVKEGFHTAERLSDPSAYREAWGQLIEDIYEE